MCFKPINFMYCVDILCGQFLVLMECQRLKAGNQEII